MESRFLVTGASGFLGRHLLQALQAEPLPRAALALVRSPKAWAGYEWSRKLDRVDVLEGSVLAPAAWRDDPRLDGVRGVFHLAAVVRHSRRGDVDEVYRTNVEGTANVVREAAARGWRVVYVSTSGTVGCFATPHESADERSAYGEAAVRRWPYYDSKLQAEREARRLADAHGVELAIVRPPVLLGPGDHRFRSTGQVLRWLRGRLPFLIRGGMNFADVRDAARALVRAMEREQVRPVYHLPGTASSVAGFFAMAAEVAGVPAPRFVLPYRPAWLLATALERTGLLPDPVVIEMARRYWGLRSLFAADELGYAVRDPHDTLRDTIAWLRQHHEAFR